MQYQSKYISVGSQQLHYLETGTGRQLLLAFHGYGNDANLFAGLCDHLAAAYTVLSFDLPHHGGSKWADQTLFTKTHLTEMVAALSAQYHADRVSLIGYSMGGRVCLSIIACMPAVIERAILVATDGLRQDPAYHFFTQNYFGKKLFRHLLGNADFYMRFVHLGKRLRLIEPGRHKFITQSLPTESGRHFLLRVWPAMSALTTEPEQLRAIIREHRIPVAIFMGANDRIIPPALAEKFKTGLETVELHILEKGHRIFDDKNTRLIAQCLLRP